MVRENKKIGVIALPVERLHIELTSFCNFSCEFCPDSRMQRKRGFMDFDMLKDILSEVKEEGIAKSVFFHVMGEPLLYPKLLDAISYAKGKDISTCVTTNGGLLTTEYLNNMAQAGLSTIILSLQTPDKDSFRLRGVNSISFDEYSERIKAIAQEVIKNKSINLRIDFLSSPLRRLIIPIAKEVSISDTSAKLRAHLKLWAEKILKDTPLENRLTDVVKQIKKAKSFKENSILITDNLSFHTRIVGDWATHFNNKIVKARFGYCPGIQENFGILWDGGYTFCCTDFDGRTSTHNYKDTPIKDYLSHEMVQDIVRGFNRFKVIHPYCRQCLGDRSILNAFVKQIGSIVYFKWFRNMNNKNTTGGEKIWQLN